jgi:hypothetical protein
MDLFGGAKKTTKSKKTKKTSDAKKTTKASDAKKPKKSTTTRSKSKAKGGNFLGTVGDLVAPTGWGPFATAAGLLALDRADAALRRGTKEKKEKMEGGKKMKGGEMTCVWEPQEFTSNGTVYKVCCTLNGKKRCGSKTFVGTPRNTDAKYKDVEKMILSQFNRNKNN